MTSTTTELDGARRPITVRTRPNDDARKGRIEEAARFVDLDQCALSHQCGFSSTVHGNTLTIDEQWPKLERMVSIASQVWG